MTYLNDLDNWLTFREICEKIVRRLLELHAK